jgi:hypothetical protein
MVSRRNLAVFSVCLSLCVSPALVQARLDPPMGILAQAQNAQLNSAKAYVGLSVFAGETLSTGEMGRLDVRVGRARLILEKGASASLQKLENGTHVDLSSGSLSFNTPENGRVEVHVADATFRPETNVLSQAAVEMLGPNVLQVHPVHGNLEFSYRDEFQLLPEGETYRIYLDAPAEAQKPAGAGAPSISPKRKTVIYIVTGVAATGLVVWGIHELVEGAESPSNPSRPK